MANSLNRNARLQQENYLLSIQQERYTNLCNAIEETRQARHDMRHHFLQLSSMAEAGDLEKIKEYLYNVTQKIPTMHMHFCKNQVIDSVISYYCLVFIILHGSGWIQERVYSPSQSIQQLHNHYLFSPFITYHSPSMFPLNLLILVITKFHPDKYLFIIRIYLQSKFQQQD